MEWLTGVEIVHVIQSAYLETVLWRRNTFIVPLGKAGKYFIPELAVLFTAFANSSALESAALSAIMVASAILLQKLHPMDKLTV